MAATKRNRYLKEEKEFVHPVELKEGLTVKCGLSEMRRNPQDEIGLDGQREAQEILSSMQNFCFIR